jgi:hypothetical protein
MGQGGKRLLESGEFLLRGAAFHLKCCGELGEALLVTQTGDEPAQRGREQDEQTEE